nr:Uncharacterised protein [Ipomoea batatas]GME16871.1 Uncharacterised protein [Ipomoea batatas]
MCSSGTSTIAICKGSSNLSFTFLLITLGGPTMNSYPSLRMFSINMVMCKVPRPLTINVSAVSPSSTFIARFRSSSRYKRSLKFLLVTYLPSRPTKGEMLTENAIFTVGSSTVMVGNAFPICIHHLMCISGRPFLFSMFQHVHAQ